MTNNEYKTLRTAAEFLNSYTEFAEEAVNDWAEGSYRPSDWPVEVTQILRRHLMGFRAVDRAEIILDILDSLPSV